jgi:hypothetical protein
MCLRTGSSGQADPTEIHRQVSRFRNTRIAALFLFLMLALLIAYEVWKRG